jgi:5-deoxy-glucuronate isomerase
MQTSLEHLRDLQIERVRLAPDAAPTWYATGDREFAALILVGKVDVSINYAGNILHWHSVGRRPGVFNGLPYCVYAGPNSSLTFSPRDGPVDILLASAPTKDSPSFPVLVRPEDVKTHVIGEGHYHRMVREIIGEGGPAQRLRIGETINPPGCWSSWPPHEFDSKPELAPDFEEVFTVFTKGLTPDRKNGEAYLRRKGIFCDGTVVDDWKVLHNGESVVVPLGQHPIVAGVDCHLLYVWCYISPVSKHYAQTAEDHGYYQT